MYDLSKCLKKFSMCRNLPSCIVGIGALSVFDSKLLLEGQKLLLHYLVNRLLANQSS